MPRVAVTGFVIPKQRSGKPLIDDFFHLYYVGPIGYFKGCCYVLWRFGMPFARRSLIVPRN